jgi:sugar phosphate isomerase/epimerase
MSRNAPSFGCNTYSYTIDYSIEDCLVRLADFGFVEFELMMYPDHLWPRETDAARRAALRRLIAGRGLRIVTLNMPNIDMNVAGASAEMRRYTLDLLRGIVELAGDLGAPGVVVGPGKANPLFPAPRDNLEGYFFAALDELAPLAKKVGTALWVENMPFAFIPDIEGLMRALDRYGNDDIGVVYDVANGYFVKENLGNALRRCRQRLKLVHFSDTGQQVYRHDPVGLGSVPFAEVPPVLKEIGYNRLPMLEIIAPDAEKGILESTDKLAALGYARGVTV